MKMNLDQWLTQVYSEDTLTKEASGIEAMFDRMDPSVLLDVACGRTTLEKEAAPIKGYKEDQKKSSGVEKTSAAKLAFMDNIARQIARTHAEVIKEAQCAKEPMIKEDEFTSPEAQAKAKVMQQSMQMAKGAPAPLRQKAVSAAGRSLSKSAAENSEQEVNPKSWLAGQKGIYRATRPTDAKGIEKHLVDPNLIGSMTIKRTTHGLAGAGIGAGGGAAIGAGIGGKRGAVIGTLIGGALGAKIGDTHGILKANKDYLAKKGITPTMLGLGRGRFTREAAEKYLKD
jgi:hypothetical protein